MAYTSNINPAFSTTVRLESKGQNENGCNKEIKYRTWYTCKTVVCENVMYMKVWENGSGEPETWDVTKYMNDEVNNDCMLGLEFYASSGKSVYVGNVKIELIKEE